VRKIRTTYSPHWAALSLALLALTLPLGYWDRLLYIFHLHHLALIPLILVTGYYWKKYQRISTPFELWFPATLLILFALLPASPQPPLHLAMAAALFVLTYHVCDSSALVFKTLQFSLLGNSLALLLNSAARWEWIYPTFFDPASALSLAGPTKPESCLTSLVLVIIIPFALESARRTGMHRSGTFITWLERAALLLPPFFFFSPETLSLKLFAQGGQIFLPAALPLTLTALWFIARIAAKLKIASSHLPEILARTFAGLVLIAAACFLLAGILPDNNGVLVLALLAAVAKPALLHHEKTVGKGYALLLAPVLLLLTLNILIIRSDDPRNYEYRAQRALQHNDLDGLQEHLDFVQERCPGERRADYYEARLLVALDNLDGARKSFELSLQPGRNILLPPPGEKEIELFLEEIRDRSSAQPESLRGIAYEQALLAAGRERHALSLLEIRGRTPPQENTDATPLAGALASFLEAPELEEQFARWDAALLADILQSVTPFSEIQQAPPAFPPALLPFVASIRPDFDSLEGMLFTPSFRGGGTVMLSSLQSDSIMPSFEPGIWDLLREDSNQHWYLDFSDRFTIRLSPEADFQFHRRIPLEDTLIEGMPHLMIYMPHWEDSHDGF
jgi:hypothetical protein